MHKILFCLQKLETVTIIAGIVDTKRSEFFQVMESLKPIIKSYCNDFELKIAEDNSLAIHITFDNKNDLKKKFYNKEFNILKGAVQSLCNNVKVKINEDYI